MAHPLSRTPSPTTHDFFDGLDAKFAIRSLGPAPHPEGACWLLPPAGAVHPRRDAHRGKAAGEAGGPPAPSGPARALCLREASCR